MSDTIFAYGTLMVPEIWQSVTGLSCPSPARSGLLRGYQRRRIEGADFPGIFSSGEENDSVQGCIYENITPEIFDRLDRYEDHFYERVEVSVEIEGSASTTLSCQTYIIPVSGVAILSDDIWDIENFRKNALNRYLDALGIQKPK